MSTQTSNNVAFRLPEDHLRELNRLAAKRNKSKGQLAKDIVMRALMDLSHFDELNHRLGAIERLLEHLVQQSERLQGVEASIHMLRASLATATTRLLVEATQTDLRDAVAWIKDTFAVKEET